MGLLYVNLYAIGLTKALFNKMNHRGLFIKLMMENIPSKLPVLLLLERWFSVCVTCVKCYVV